jgi:hypothetical protein
MLRSYGAHINGPHALTSSVECYPADPAASTAAAIMLDDLAWWATALRQARQDHPLPPAALRKMAAAGSAH